MIETKLALSAHRRDGSHGDAHAPATETDDAEHAKTFGRALDTVREKAAPREADDDDEPATKDAGTDAAALASLMAMMLGDRGERPNVPARESSAAPAGDGERSLDAPALELGPAARSELEALATKREEGAPSATEGGASNEARDVATALAGRLTPIANPEAPPQGLEHRLSKSAPASSESAPKPGGAEPGSTLVRPAGQKADGAEASTSVDQGATAKGPDRGSMAHDATRGTTRESIEEATVTAKSSDTGMPLPASPDAPSVHRSPAAGAPAPAAPASPDAHSRPEGAQVSLLTVKHATHAEVEHAELGRVSIDAHERAGVIDVTLRASNVETAAALVAIEPALRAELHDKALSLGDYQVDRHDSLVAGAGDGSPNSAQNGGERRRNEPHAGARDHESTSATPAPWRPERRVRIVL